MKRRYWGCDKLKVLYWWTCLLSRC